MYIGIDLGTSSLKLLLTKADGNVIRKKRYLIPLKNEAINEECRLLVSENGLMIELDVFEGALAPLVLAEIEFPSLEAANAYQMHPMFAEDVTNNPNYHNSNMIFTSPGN